MPADQHRPVDQCRERRIMVELPRVGHESHRMGPGALTPNPKVDVGNEREDDEHEEPEHSLPLRLHTQALGDNDLLI